MKLFNKNSENEIVTLLKWDNLRLEEAIQRVCELHKPFSKSEIICDCCACIYPCPTIQALNGEK